MAGTAVLDTAVLRAWADGAVAALEVHRAELDALNVFPVADSDTGTNLWLTLREGREALVERADDAARRFARGALVGARGNSGVIVSQYLGELLRGLPVPVSAEGLAAALRAAADAAYRAVARPVEGTVLTVARAVADGAREVAGAAAGPADVLAAALDAGYLALRGTADQLAPLRAAGVLDAGGWGLLLVLGALGEALGGPVVPPLRPALPDRDHACHDAEQGGAFEVMYVVADGAAGGHDGPLADRLRRGLAEVGDSVVVVGGDGLWQAHVHTDTPLDAVACAAALGVTATQVRVRHIARQAGVHGAHAPALGLVAVTGAAGLTADLARAGAVVVLVPPGRGAGPELDRAVDDTGADDVLVLAAGGLAAGGGRGRARVRAGLSEVQVVVGAATLATLAGRDLDAGGVAEAVLTAVEGVRTGSVPGTVGGAGHADAVVTAALDLVDADTSILTALAGTAAPADLAERLTAALPSSVEVVVLPTGLPDGEVVLGAETGTA